MEESFAGSQADLPGLAAEQELLRVIGDQHLGARAPARYLEFRCGRDCWPTTAVTSASRITVPRPGPA